MTPMPVEQVFDIDRADTELYQIEMRHDSPMRLPVDHMPLPPDFKLTTRRPARI